MIDKIAEVIMDPVYKNDDEFERGQKAKLVIIAVIFGFLFFCHFVFHTQVLAGVW